MLATPATLPNPTLWAMGHKATKPTAAQTVINVLAAYAAVAAVCSIPISQFHSQSHFTFHSAVLRLAAKFARSAMLEMELSAGTKQAREGRESVKKRESKEDREREREREK